MKRPTKEPGTLIPPTIGELSVNRWETFFAGQKRRPQRREVRKEPVNK